MKEGVERMFRDEEYDEIVIPKITYEGGDSKLLERVIKLKKGSIRIAVFILVGMIKGWFSYSYVTDTFIITKIILCIPYKISEAIYASIIGTDAMTCGLELGLNIFFPQSAIATIMAERVTPVLIGAMLYGSMAYFTGDKRVFTLQRFVKFVSVQLIILALFVSSVYVVNAKAVSDNNHLKGVDGFYFDSDICQALIAGEEAKELLEYFYVELKEDSSIIRKPEEEIRIEIVYANHARKMAAYIHPIEHYLVTQKGATYHVSGKFTECVQEYADTGRIAHLGIGEVEADE